MAGNDRKSNIELLRVISMIMVTLYHFTLHADSDTIMIQTFSLNQFFAFFFGSWGNIANYVFFAITAYFLIKKDSVNIGALMSLAFKTSIIGVILYSVAVATGVLNFSLLSLVKSSGGLLTYQYWFLSAYVVLMVLSPALNIAIMNISKKYYQLLLIMLFLSTTLMLSRLDLMGRIGGAVLVYFLVGYFERFIREQILVKISRWGFGLIIGGVTLYECIWSALKISTLGVDFFQPLTAPTGILGGYFSSTFSNRCRLGRAHLLIF